MPVPHTCHEGVCNQFDIVLDDESLGVIQRVSKGWKMPQMKDQGLVKAIGNEISLWSK
jgi:hypothetical protein